MELKAIRTAVDFPGAGYVYFKVDTDLELSKEQIRQLQIEAGYHPGG